MHVYILQSSFTIYLVLFSGLQFSFSLSVCTESKLLFPLKPFSTHRGVNNTFHRMEQKAERARTHTRERTKGNNLCVLTNHTFIRRPHLHVCIRLWPLFHGFAILWHYQNIIMRVFDANCHEASKQINNSNNMAKQKRRKKIARTTANVK